MAAAAAAAGASASTVDALRKDADAQRDERRSAGGRLDAARAKAARAQRLADEASQAARIAAARAADAEAAATIAAAELREVEASLAKAAAETSAPRTVVEDVRRLLAALEVAPLGGTPGIGPALPEAVLAAMAALRQQVDAPAPEARLDEALSPADRGKEGDGAETAEDADQDSLMGALDSADDSDEAAMLAIARRLKRARRN